MTTTEPAGADPAGDPAETIPTCYRHAKRETYVRCTRCDRYMCPDCMRDAVVGHQCVECVRSGSKTMRQPRTAFGGRVTATPVVTFVLIGLNALAYLAEVAWPSAVHRLDSLGIALERFDGQVFLYEGFVPPGHTLTGIAGGEWHRLITSAFLHLPPTAGAFAVAHIVLNMLALWRLGPAVEEVFGPLRFVALYLLAALGGSALGYLVSPTAAAVGASGAIFGLVAAYFIASRRLRRNLADAGQVLVFALIWLVVSAGFTSWEGHLGGLLTGTAVALAFAHAPRRRRDAVQAAAGVTTLIVLGALVAVRTAQLTGAL